MIDFALTAQVLFWLIMIGVFLASGQASVFHPVTVYLLFHGLVFVLRPILVHCFDFDANWHYMLFQPTDAYFIKTLAVTSVGLLCFTVSCTWAGWSQPGFADLRRPSLSPLERRALLVTTLLLLPAIAYSIFATRNGIAGERLNGIYIMTNSTGYVNEAQDFIMPLLCAWILTTRFHWLNSFAVTLYIGYRVWFGWSRWTILLFFVLITFAYCWYCRRKWVPLWSIAVAIPILVLFNYLGHDRDILKQYLAGDKIQAVRFDAGMTGDEKLKERLDTQDYANFDYLAYVVSMVPARTGTYTYWKQYLQLFTEPIPRILWRGKPIGAPVKTINLGAYGNFTGLTVSLCGDGWMDGGWLGLMVTLSVVGLLLGRSHRWFWNHQGKNTVALLYLVGLAMVPQWYRDGGISIAKFLLFNLAPIFVWLAFKWLLGPRLVPLKSVLLPRGTRLRLLSADVQSPEPHAVTSSVQETS